MKTTYQPIKVLDKQQGAVLIVSLLLLVVITTLAVSGMNTATTELAMARNDQNYEFAFQAAVDKPALRMHTDADWFSESDRGIRTLARQADSLGMHIILKPHIWVGRYSTGGQSRDAIGFETEEGWQTWEAQYRTFMMHYAHLAEDIDAAMLVVGTELANAVKTRPAFWRSLIAEVRTVYGGPLTYAANWWEEYEAVTFWDDLDYIGIQAYFELSKEDGPTAAMLHEGWKPYKETMRQLSEYTGRPVLFTEIGYRNVPFAAAQPWRWPSREDLDNVAPDVFDGPVIPEMAQAFVSDARHHMAVALDGELVVGIASAVDYLHPDKPLQLWINELGVAPPYQRRGIARQLMEALLEHARQLGCQEVWVGTETDNLPARALYASVGGREEPMVMFSFRTTA